MDGTSENILNIFETKCHTEKILGRRKALFPSDDADSDLGHMSPLHSNSNSNISSDPLESLVTISDRPFFGFSKTNIDDYIIFDTNEANASDYVCSTPSSVRNIMTDSNMSPLYLSPFYKLMSSPILYSPQETIIPLTPIGKSPTSKLQTPHDTSTIKMNCKQPKRKLINIDLIVDESENKDHSSLESKSCKLDTSLNKSKVRTALFPDNSNTITLPTKSFYPKENQRAERSSHDVISETKKTKHKAPPLYLCNRRIKTRNRYGQINAGVRHKIKKPKQKNVAKSSIIKTTLNIMEKTPLNEYFEKMACKKTSFMPTQIKPIVEQNKENISINTEKIYILKSTQNEIINKKFFKTMHSHGIVTINKNIKLEVEKGKMQLLENKTTHRKRKLDLDASDLAVPEECIDIDISTILASLSDSGIKMDDSQNSKLSLNKADMILSPTSQMCDMASGLAINSPKRARLNINALLDDSYQNTISNKSSVVMEQQKLFPIFYEGNKNHQPKNIDGVKTSHSKKFKVLAENQMLLDAGQKRFGVTQCHECNSVYTMGDPSEELMHLNFHNGVNILKLNGWKNENVVYESLEERIIKISPGDSKAWWKKVKDVIEFINRDLGFFEKSFLMEQSQIFFYIKNKQIIGCLVADPKDTAFKMLSTNGVDMCSIETYPIKCGVSRIWVSSNNRKQGIATTMMNTLRSNFMFGNILSTKDIAVSSPTYLGKLFASKYFKTEHFYIYF